MSQDMSCFDMTGIELVKKKYYNAAKVTEFVENLKSAFEAMAEENTRLKTQLESLTSQKTQISDTLMSAQSIARQMIDDAKAQAEEATRLAQTQAEETVLAAEKKAELILSGAKSRKDASDAEVTQVQEYALRCVENCVDKLRQQHKDAIELINAQWQDFLSGLILPEDRHPAPAESEPADPTLQPEQPVDWMAVANMDFSDIEQQYADIDADTFFSGNFFNEQSGSNILSELKAMMDSIEHPTEE